MSFTNRIPRDSVSFSNIKTKINQQSDFQSFDGNFERNINANEKEIELSKREQECIDLMNKIEEEKEKLFLLQNHLEQEKEKMFFEIQKEKERLEREKTIELQKMKNFMWDASIKIAERIVKQELKKEQLDLIELLKNTLKELPISFNKLEIVANPETVKIIKEMNNKESWLFDDINWKYNFDLEIGDFIIEYEDEIYNATISEQFENIRREIEELRKDSDD